MNVVFLALSTFSADKDTGELPVSELYYGNELIGRYHYQLEPVIMLLKHQGVDVDKVFMVCTKKTKSEKEFSLDGVTKTCSEEQFFRNYIKEQLGDNVDVISFDVGEDEVEMVKSLIKNMRECNRDGNIRLTIDIHGGLRDTQMLIQSIITLLKYENIVPDDIYTVSYDQRSRQGVIDLADKTYDINQYVVGMSEFLSYGRTKTLEAYYKDQDSEFIDIIKDISDSIQLCHIRKFDNAIKKINEYVDGYVDKGNYDDIFMETIKSSFGLLMNKKGRNKVVNKVRWCVDNDFVQQALTIIESQMPTELLQRKVIVYETDENKCVPLYIREDDDNLTMTDKRVPLKEALKFKKPSWESEINFTLINWARENCCKKVSGKNNTRYIELMEIKGDSVDHYLYFKVPKGCLKQKCVINTDPREKAIKLRFVINEKLGVEGKRSLARLLMLHLALKGERNGSNHASNEDRATVDEVKTAINAYIELTDLVLERVKKKDKN